MKKNRRQPYCSDCFRSNASIRGKWNAELAEQKKNRRLVRDAERYVPRWMREGREDPS